MGIKEFDFIIGEVEKGIDENTMDYYTDTELTVDINKVMIKELKRQIKELENDLRIAKEDKEMLIERMKDYKVKIFDYMEAYGEFE